MTGHDLDWIVPVAAAVQAVVTVVLVGVTAKYVRLTKQIVQTGQQQLSDARAILEAQTGIARSRLQVLASRLLKTLEGLPDTGISDHQLRHSSMWSQGDEERLLDLATAVGAPIASKTPEILSAMVWIRQLYGRIMQVSPAMGYRTSTDEDRHYIDNRKRAVDGLRIVVESIV